MYILGRPIINNCPHINQLNLITYFKVTFHFRTRLQTQKKQNSLSQDCISSSSDRWFAPQNKSKVVQLLNDVSSNTISNQDLWSFGHIKCPSVPGNSNNCMTISFFKSSTPLADLHAVDPTQMLLLQVPRKTSTSTMGSVASNISTWMDHIND